MKRLLEGVIDEVIIQPAKVKPIIVNFQNGELKDDEANKMSCGLFYDKRKDKTLLALSNGQIVYKGYKPDSQQQLTQTMLVLHNKKTGKIRLVQAERWSVSPVLHKPVIENNKNIGDDKIALLNKEFGSKKLKRKTEQFERMKINVNAVKEDLEKTVSKIEIDKTDLETHVPLDEYITNISLPPCNRDATDVKDVYNLNDIIPEDKLITLYEKAANIIPTDCKSKFFTHALRVLKSDPDNVKKIAILLYIDAIANWLNTPIKAIRKRTLDICPHSVEVNSYITETYSLPSSSGRLRPTSMKDKALIHCIILGLIASDFILDVELFATTFNNRIGVKKLLDIAKIVAAVPNKDNRKIVTLKIPLPNQVAVIKRGRKKQS